MALEGKINLSGPWFSHKENGDNCYLVMLRLRTDSEKMQNVYRETGVAEIMLMLKTMTIMS